MKALCPAILNAGEMPTQKVLAGPLPDRLFTGTKATADKLTAAFLGNGGKVTLVLDGWEQVCHEYLMNFVAVVGTAAIL